MTHYRNTYRIPFDIPPCNGFRCRDRQGHRLRQMFRKVHREMCIRDRMSDRQLRRYRTSGQLVGFHFGRRLMFSTAEINRFIERVEMEHKQKKLSLIHISKMSVRVSSVVCFC